MMNQRIEGESIGPGGGEIFNVHRLVTFGGLLAPGQEGLLQIVLRHRPVACWCRTSRT